MLAVVARSGGADLEKPAEVMRGQAARLSWAWDRLCFATTFNAQTHAGMRDVVSGVAPSTVAETIWTRDRRGNPVLRFTEPGTAPRMEWTPDYPTHRQPTTALTAYVRMQRLGTPDSDGAAFCMPYGFTDPWETWSIAAPSGAETTLYGEIGIGTTQYLVGNTATIPTTEQVSAFLRWRSGEAPRLDVLGERGNLISGLTGGTVGTGSLAYAAGNGVRLNCHESTSSNYYGYYSQAMVWSRRLTDVEIVALVSDPFGWYAPQRTRLTVAGPFPVGPGMAAMGLQLLGGSGARR